jgi:tRNA pseudouridine55 synthase
MNMKQGILLVDKPVGMTSHDVVSRVRRKLHIKKVGHAGTLDPLATGLLIILVGQATKLFDKLSGHDKAYRSTLILGRTTDTGDIQGRVLREEGAAHITDGRIREVFGTFLGELMQFPPMYSAVRHKGKKLYELARKGVTVEREARPIRVDRLEIENIENPQVEFYLECSKGTYVRQLAVDIGEQLGCGACISRIQRTKIGSFDLNDAVSLDEIDESHIKSWTG